jgi:hypothetical protein
VARLAEVPQVRLADALHSMRLSCYKQERQTSSAGMTRGGRAGGTRIGGKAGRGAAGEAGDWPAQHDLAVL